MIFELMEKDEFEQIVFCHDSTSGLKAIIAIHDTTLGPAIGGCRFYPYEREEDALIDAMRLAKGMTYKNAVAGINHGGAKGVIIGDPSVDKDEFILRAFGRYVDSLNGRYITSVDMGMTSEDVDVIHTETPFTIGLSESYHSSGNPAGMTALGVYKSLESTVLEMNGDTNLKGLTIAIQGVGSVGMELAKLLHEAGAKLIVSDVNDKAVQEAVERFDAIAVDNEDIYSVEADIFSPCGIGAILNDETIPQLKVKAVCGSANNQLADEIPHAEMLKERGILYAPDFVANAGGVINASDELQGYNKTRARAKVEQIYAQMNEVYEIARKKDITTAEAADILAERRIEKVKNLRSNFLMKNRSAYDL
ncbi:Glu/Leu/Phe/Val family dehydrogenase [Dolosicoccus paucivorans]|uniref:Glu/Leu/Phe/Val family dehydrogenase n=1 Tax=Dolosicoccus paucivorans TaxID=84521 RepID=UPI00088D186E|nr:Glu/Leu/Phe/Val dehydrogenase [Dolosicoccus paucivorans]SDI58113.1 leucine dehydrogenase [Dolosicoccus paucivorans]